MDADAVYRWAQVLALIATSATACLAIARTVRQDRLVKRQLERLDELEKVASIAPAHLDDHVRALQREVIADYLATTLSGAWNRIGIAKLPMAATAAAVAMFSMLTGMLVASIPLDQRLPHIGALIPFCMVVGAITSAMVGWQVLGRVMGRRALRDELHRRFMRGASIEGIGIELDLPAKLRRGANILGAVAAFIMSLGLTAGTILTLTLIAEAPQSWLTTLSMTAMLVAVALSLGFMIGFSNGPEKYGELALKTRYPARSLS